MDQDERDSLMPAIATALSHDIKSIVGTIGRKARILLSFADSNKNDSSNGKKILTEIINQIQLLYDATESLRDKVRKNEIVDRGLLAESIQKQILELMPELHDRARLLPQDAAVMERFEDLEVLRKTVSRLEKIIRSMVNSLRDGSSPAFIQTNLVNHVDFAKEALFDLLTSTKTRVDVSGAGSVFADQGSVLVILINLIENAVKYRAPERSLLVNIRIDRAALQELKMRFKPDFDRRAAPDQWYLVSVSDNGKGVEREHWNKIFDFGYRTGDQNNTDDDGSFGLGLSRCRELMKAHNGKIFLSESTPRGTTFTLVFPQNPRDVVLLPRLLLPPPE